MMPLMKIKIVQLIKLILGPVKMTKKQEKLKLQETLMLLILKWQQPIRVRMRFFSVLEEMSMLPKIIHF